MVGLIVIVFVLCVLELINVDDEVLLCVFVDEYNV